MKVLTVLLFVFLSSPLFAQQISFDELGEVDKKPKGTFYSYVSKDGMIYNAGQRLRIGRPSTGKAFSFISEFSMLGSVTPAEVRSTNSETEIVNFKASGNQRMGLKIWMKSKAATGMSSYIIDFENAIDSGELIGYGMTSDQALSELKKAKDKLDLELITKEQYEEKKKELSVFIK